MAATKIFIPIGRGSKGIPNKNMRFLCDKPLVCGVIDTLLSMEIPTSSIWASTDSIAAEITLHERYGYKINIFIRSDSNATDASPVIEVSE